MTTIASDPQSPPHPSAADTPLLALPVTGKRPQPLPWTPQETSHLIQAYKEKWYSLQRRPLRASQWEEVSITVAARCGLDDPSRTSLQCRHKLEKLRKRYRIEKTRHRPGGAGNPVWEFFDAMERLEVGPLPISARPMAGSEYLDSGEDDEEDEDDEVQEGNYRDGSNSRDVNHILLEPSFGKTRVFENGRLSKFRGPMFGRRMEEEEGNEDGDEYVGGRGGGGVASRLAAEMRKFAGRFARMENKRMEMMRETERCRMEMENKRMEMIVESQKRMVDTISRAIGSHKKLKMALEL